MRCKGLPEEGSGFESHYMDLDLESLFGPMCTAVYSLAEIPQHPPPPTSYAVGLIYEDAIGQPR